MDYLVLAVVGFIAAITPGPDVFYVIRQGLCKGKKAALYAVFGILTGNIVYLTLVGVGLGSIGHNPYFQFIVGLLGGIYLLKISYLIFNDKPKLERSCDMLEKFSIYRQALLLNLSNPKAMIFFAIIVTPFMGKNLLLSLVSLFVGIAGAFLTAAFFSSKFEIKENVLVIINKLSSFLFLFFSFSLFKTAFQALNLILNL